jgi:hypothetical protein
LGKILEKVRKDLFQQKEKINSLLAKAPNNAFVAEALSITPRVLYEKMIAFKIQNREYWIS